MKVVLTGGVLALTALLFFSATQTLPLGEDPAVLADFEKTKAELVALRTEQGTMNDNVAQLTQKLAQAEASSKALSSKNAELAASNADLALTVSTLETASVATKESEQALKTMLQTAYAKVETLNGQVAGLSEEKAALTGENSELSGEIAVLTTANADLVTAHADLKSANADLTSENVTLASANADATARILELEAVSVNADAAPVNTQELAELQERFDQHVASLTQAEQQITDLTEALSAERLASADITQQATFFEAEVERLVARVGDLAGTLSERESVIADLKANTSSGTETTLASCQEQTDAVLAGGPIQFDRGSTNIAAESIPSLEEIANIAATCVAENLSLEIEGHTDGVGGDASNLLLSTSRADAVYAFLEEKAVPAEAMRSVGFGESEPIADNATSEGQAQNRRIIFDWEIR